MITFSCKTNEKILLPTYSTAVEVLKIEHGIVSLGIEGPPDAPVLGDAPSAEGETLQAQLMRQLSDRLQITAMGLGLMRLQLDAGLTEEVKALLAQIQDEFRLLRYGVEGAIEDAPPRRAGKPVKPRMALLVEDDRNERELLAGFLRQSGLKVDTAGDGSDALDYLGTHSKPDVILLDMGLPRVDGPTTVREIRRNPAFAGLKIFGVTGHLPEEFDLERGPHGIDRWFHKPLDPAALVHDLVEELDGVVCGA